MILARIGDRLYEFNNHEDVTKAVLIHAPFIGNQNDLETEMENAGIDFTLEFD